MERVVEIIVLITETGFHFVFCLFCFVFWWVGLGFFLVCVFWFCFCFLAVIYQIYPAICFGVLAEEKQKLSFLKKWHLCALLELVCFDLMIAMQTEAEILGRLCAECLQSSSAQVCSPGLDFSAQNLQPPR